MGGNLEGKRKGDLNIGFPPSGIYGVTSEACQIGSWKKDGLPVARLERLWGSEQALQGYSAEECSSDPTRHQRSHY